MLLLLFIVGCLSYELKQVNISVDHIAVHKHIYVSNYNMIYNISKEGEVLNSFMLDGKVKSLVTHEDKLFILDYNNDVIYYGKFNFSLKTFGFVDFIIKYDYYAYLIMAIGGNNEQTIVVYYDLYYGGTYVVHYIIDGLYSSSSVSDMDLILSTYSFIYSIDVFGIKLIINTTNKVTSDAGDIVTNGTIIVLAEYKLYLYDFTGKLLETFTPSNGYIMFNPIIYKDTILYSDYFSNKMTPFIQFIDFKGNKLFNLEYGYECHNIEPNTKMDVYGNIISYLCGILNIWLNK